MSKDLSVEAVPSSTTWDPVSSSNVRTTSIWSIHDNAIAATNLRRAGGVNRAANRVVVMSSYMDLPFAPREYDPLVWWKEKKSESVLNIFLPIVQKFLCIPATSVPCEYIFSKAAY